MRTISTADEKILSSGNYAAHVRVRIKDSGGTWQDMTTLAGNNWLVSASWGENVDSPIGTATVELARRIGRLSLSLLDEASKVNQVSSSYSPLLLPGREIKIETSITPQVGTPSTWLENFHGEIERVSWDSDPVRIECRDLACRLQRSFIEWEWLFATGAPDDRPAWVWEPNTDMATARDGAIVHALPSVVVDGNYFYVTSGSPGVTGSTEPAWRTDYTPFSDGTQTWVNSGRWMGGGCRVDNLIVALMSYAVPAAPSVTFRKVGTPSWVINPYRQDRTNLLDACRTLAQQIGWDLRMKWYSGTPGFYLTMYSPDRTKSTADRTFSPSQYRSITGLELGRENIRNVVRVVYSDASTLATNGVDKVRKYVQVTDSASISKYGRAFCEIAESSTSQIDTSTEATDLANAILSDLSEPEAEKSVTMGAFPFVELGDMYCFAANGVHYSSDQTLAVVGYSHKASSKSFSTTMQLRGKVSGGFKTWHARIARRARSDMAPAAPATPSVANFPGRSVVTVVPPDRRWDDCELYVSSTNNFTPGSANLYARGRQTSFTVNKAAGTYYGRVIIRDSMGNASVPSAQFTLAPT